MGACCSSETDCFGRSPVPVGGAVVVQLTVANVDYPRLAKNESVLSAFKIALKESIAAAAGRDVMVHHVVLTLLSAGSVVVEATVYSDAIAAVRSALKSAPTLGPSLAALISNVDGIGEVSKDKITVEIGSVVARAVRPVQDPTETAAHSPEISQVIPGDMLNTCISATSSNITGYMGFAGDAPFLALRCASRTLCVTLGADYCGWIEPPLLPVSVIVSSTDEVRSHLVNQREEDEARLILSEESFAQGTALSLCEYTRNGRFRTGRWDQLPRVTLQMSGFRARSLFHALGTLTRRHGVAAKLCDTTCGQRAAFDHWGMRLSWWEQQSIWLQDDPRVVRRLRVISTATQAVIMDHTFLDTDAERVCTALRKSFDGPHRALVKRLRAACT